MNTFINHFDSSRLLENHGLELCKSLSLDILQSSSSSEIFPPDRVETWCTSPHAGPEPPPGGGGPPRQGVHGWPAGYLSQLFTVASYQDPDSPSKKYKSGKIIRMFVSTLIGNIDCIYQSTTSLSLQ